MIIDIFLILIILVLIYGLYNSSKKIDFYENLVDERDKWILELKSRLTIVDERLKVVDNNGAFESDDEVGWTFKSIKELLDYVTELK